MTYRELQTALREMRDNGTDVRVKLNAKADVLQQEYERLCAIQDEDASKCEQDDVDYVDNVVQEAVVQVMSDTSKESSDVTVSSHSTRSLTSDSTYKPVDYECDGSSCDLPDGYYIARFAAINQTVVSTATAINPTAPVRRKNDPVSILLKHYVSLGFSHQTAMHCAKYNLTPSKAFAANPELKAFEKRYQKTQRVADSRKRNNRFQTITTWFNKLVA